MSLHDRYLALKSEIDRRIPTKNLTELNEVLDLQTQLNAVTFELIDGDV
jgi:hypothetical protein